MNKYLRNEYGVTVFEEIMCIFIRRIRGCKGIPDFVYRWSYKLYGWKDNLARFWWAKFYGIPVGKYSYGYNNFIGGRLASVGKYCSIAVNQTIAAGNHKMKYATTSPIVTIRDFGFVENDEILLKGVTIGNDVWIGASCTIFDGVTIGDGACIGAGSIIRKDVPPYAVVVGVDRIVRYRFDKETIDKLRKLKWWDWDEDKIKENIELCKDTVKFCKIFS